MKIVGTVAMLLLFLSLSGCVGSPLWKSKQKLPSDVNIQVVTHPGLIKNMELVDGFTKDYPSSFRGRKLERYIRYLAYERGHKEVTVLLEIVQPGKTGSTLYINGTSSTVGASRGLARVSIYRK